MKLYGFIGKLSFSFVQIQIILYDEQNTFHANTELRVTDNMLFYYWLQS